MARRGRLRRADAALPCPPRVEPNVSSSCSRDFEEKKRGKWAQQRVTARNRPPMSAVRDVWVRRRTFSSRTRGAQAGEVHRIHIIKHSGVPVRGKCRSGVHEPIRCGPRGRQKCVARRRRRALQRAALSVICRRQEQLRSLSELCPAYSDQKISQNPAPRAPKQHRRRGRVSFFALRIHPQHRSVRGDGKKRGILTSR